MNQKPVARAWIDDQWKFVYDIREVTKGKRKGWLECTYIGSSETGPRYRKRQIKDGVRML